MLYFIMIENLVFDAIIGIESFEREKEQKIRLDGIFEYQDTQFLDYGILKNKIIELFIFKKYFLLEDALQDVIKELKQNFPSLKSIELSIKKPNIFSDCIVGIKTKIIF